eukprot:SAG11_NODE_3358_length_2500_cov_2.020400_2_plen_102_part_00
MFATTTREQRADATKLRDGGMRQSILSEEAQTGGAADSPWLEAEKFSEAPGAVRRCRSKLGAEAARQAHQRSGALYKYFERSGALYKYSAQECAIQAQGDA